MSVRARPRRAPWHARRVDWKLFVSTFVAIFLAEMGDKTQLATLSAASGGASRWVVFAGASLALVATTAIAVALGETASRVIPPVWTKRAAGALFLVLGVLYLWGARGGGRAWGGTGEPPAGARG
jgi:putative Ca2+/H+ antiporter (TMEM165/GDT1 family)